MIQARLFGGLWPISANGLGFAQILLFHRNSSTVLAKVLYLLKLGLAYMAFFRRLGATIFACINLPSLCGIAEVSRLG
jgi:hypothetical protein